MNISTLPAYSAASFVRPQVPDADAPAAPDTQAAGSSLLANLQSIGAVAVRQEVPFLVAHLDVLQDYVKAELHNEAPYAQVVKNGQVLATLDNGGGMTTSAGVTFDSDGGPASGPALAQWRAEQIAAASGGRIVLSDSAQSAATWKPPSPPLSFQAYVQQRLDQEPGAVADGASRIDARA